MKQLHFEQVSVLTAPYLHHTLEYALDSIAANGFHGVIRDIRQMLKDRD